MVGPTGAVGRVVEINEAEALRDGIAAEGGQLANSCEGRSRRRHLYKGIMIIKSALDHIPVGMRIENYALRSLNTRASASATAATRNEAEINANKRCSKGECMLMSSAQGHSGKLRVDTRNYAILASHMWLL